MSRIRLSLIAGALAIVFAAPPAVATAALPLGNATLARAEPAPDARPPGSVTLAFKEVDSKTQKKKKGLTNPGEIKGFNPQPDPPGRVRQGSAVY